jgi:proteasome lid subunit RPN8/RPN11
MAEAIRVKKAVLERMLEHARGVPDEECCGVLAGCEGVITEILPARNMLASATAYEIAPKELFRLFRQMRAAALDHMGIYHSHPGGPNAPSPQDIERAYYPDVAYFIVSPLRDAARPVRGFSIRDGAVTELVIQAV